APGAKTTHLAALAVGEAEVVAVERHPGRAAALGRTAARMHARGVRVEVADAAAPRGDGPFDRVLVDPPCSGLGTLQARPDQRWRARPDGGHGLACEQLAIALAGADALAPGGTLVYATCTIAAEENEDVVARLMAARPQLALDDLRADLPLWHHPTYDRCLLALPPRDRTAGFFIARLTKHP
ncbi:MAG TPA: RsmB/NOP family class I SAM-dependent RNA methyltransferase, partial [Solirubrobacteraceae bacterium]|nr:RsmB/NOP family class I SAM-dependent RNA methyltransferase [Solirubrobacteraceae bacterium]